MTKYKRKYKVVVTMRSYRTDKDKYDTGEIVKIRDLENISFDQVLEDLNKRLINMDFLGTNLNLHIEHDDARTIIDSYSMDDDVDKLDIPGFLTVEINPVKVSPEELEEFLIGVLEIIKDKNSKVLAIGYTINKHEEFKLVKEDEKKENTIIIEFIVKKLKEV